MPSSDASSEEPVITLTLSQLRTFKFGDERLEGIRPQSPGVGDTAKVFVIPLAFGQFLAEIDKEEIYFHVEILSSHAELWIAADWMESNIRRARLRGILAIERSERDKRSKRIQELKSSFATQFPESHASHLAETFLANLAQRHEYRKVLLALNIAELLDQYDKEDQAEKSNIEAAPKAADLPTGEAGQRQDGGSQEEAQA